MCTCVCACTLTHTHSTGIFKNYENNVLGASSKFLVAVCLIEVCKLWTMSKQDYLHDFHLHSESADELLLISGYPRHILNTVCPNPNLWCKYFLTEQMVLNFSMDRVLTLTPKIFQALIMLIMIFLSSNDNYNNVKKLVNIQYYFNDL